MTFFEDFTQVITIYGATEMARGYCALCRAKELELYNTIDDSLSDAQHERACKEAGCGHPYFYPDGTTVAEAIKISTEHAKKNKK